MAHVILNSPSSMIPARNPYRAILRRDYPEPLVALLAFVLGIWLWDHYFGKPEGYAPGTEEIALVKLDRDLRLADSMVGDPLWLKWLAGVGDPVRVRSDGLRMLGKLSSADSVSPAGIEAYAVIQAVEMGRPVREVLARVPGGAEIGGGKWMFGEASPHSATWWQAKRMEEASAADGGAWKRSFDADSARLRIRAVVSRSLVWLLGGLGLVFIPHTLRVLKGAFARRPRGYGGAWTIPMGSVVFLVATLAWIGFTMTLEMGIGILPGLHPALMIFLDAAARLLPALIALGLLFRRPSHAVRTLGLSRAPDVMAVIGALALLIGIDQFLRLWMGSEAATDPGGGLSLADVGLWGLAFSVVSACLLAPLAEELLYRGVLFRSLANRLGVVAGALLSSVVFATLHFYDGFGLVSVGVFGLTCALLYAATGSLNSSILLHILYNSAIKIPEWVVYHGSLD